jgi:hypothetical protein
MASMEYCLAGQYKGSRNRFLGSKRLQTRAQSPNFLTFKEPKNRCQWIDSASLCSLAGRYGNPTPTRFLAPVDLLRIPAQICWLAVFGLEHSRGIDDLWRAGGPSCTPQNADCRVTHWDGRINYIKITLEYFLTYRSWCCYETSERSTMK